MPSTLTTIFRAMKYPNYRIFYFGQGVSLIGTWVQNIAMGWLVYRLTGSALLLGTVAFAQQIPSIVITPFAGVLADRYSRYKILIGLQFAAMAVAFILAAVVLKDRVSVPIIIILASVNGIVVAFDTPFRNAFVPDMISGRKDLNNAIALNSSLFNLARFIGPPIGGLLIAAFGEGWCFFINGVSFLAVIISLFSMNIRSAEIIKKQKSFFNELKEGINYAFGEKPLRYLLLLVGMSSFFGLPFQALLPVFAADVLHGKSEMLGFLTGALGMGALTGAFYLAARQKFHTVPKTTFRAALIFSVCLAIFSLSSNLILSFLMMSFVGFGMIVLFNSTNSIIQIISDEDKRGRVIALYSLSYMGITPLGSLLVGLLSEYIGVPYTVFAFAVICMAGALLFGKNLPVIFRRVVRKTQY
ncbi:MAG: MFS transporter [Bacteroidetes bacterium]|nr:MFS transporter [Bacteroidota bacterium]